MNGIELKFGVKLWSKNTDLIDQAVHLIEENVFDYIELFMIPDSDIAPFLVDVPYIIHVPHEIFGINIGEPVKSDFTLRNIKRSIDWADRLHAKYIILHSGYGSMEHAVKLLRTIQDNRLLIENMPKVGLGGEKMIGFSPEQIKELIWEGGSGLCLDFGHAAKAAISLGLDYKEYVNRFIELEPDVFHLSDGMRSGEKDEHLNIREGEFDIGFFLDCMKIGDPSYVTLETPRKHQDSLSEDIENLHKIQEW